MLTVYGIKNCSTMKKAFDYLQQAGCTQGAGYDFFDYKKSAIDKALLVSFMRTFGNQVINKQGRTYKDLNDSDKGLLSASDLSGTSLDEKTLSAVYEIVKDKPSILKRPIIMGEYHGHQVALIGFDVATYDQVFA